MPEEQQQVSIEQMIAHLAQQVGQVSQNQAAQAQTLQQLAQGTQIAAQAARQAAQATRPPPDPDGYSRLNEEYLKTLANDPIGFGNAEEAHNAHRNSAPLP